MGLDLQAQSLPPPTFQTIDWQTSLPTGTRNTSKTQQGILVKSAGGSAWNADAISAQHQRIIRDGAIEFTAVAQGDLTTSFAIGLTLVDSDRTRTSLDFGIQMTPVANSNPFRTIAQVYLKGSPVTGKTVDCTSSSKLSIAREGDRISFLKDGISFHSVSTATVDTSGPLLVDCCLFAQGKQMANCTIHTGDLDQDNMPDAWEKNNLGPNSSWMDLINFIPASTTNPTQPLTPRPGDLDADGVSNLQEFLDSTNPTNSLSYMTPVSWTLHSNTKPATATSGGLLKSSTILGVPTTTGWNADAISTQKIIEDGQINFKVPLDSDLAVGLASKDLGTSQADLEFAFVFNPTSTTSPVTIKRPGATINAGKYTADTVFSIQRVAGRVQFLKDGVVCEPPDDTASSGPLHIDCSLNAINSQITSCRIYTGDLDGDLMPDSWELQYLTPFDSENPLTDFQRLSLFRQNDHADTDLRTNFQEWIEGTNPLEPLSVSVPIKWAPSANVTTSLLINTLNQAPVTKQTGGSLWTNADAISFEDGTEKRIFHSGKIVFSLSTGKTLAVGLTTTNNSRNFTDLEYAIYCNAAGLAFAYESGDKMKDLGAFDATTSFALQRLAGRIAFLKDGIIYHTSIVPTTASLLVDCSLFHVGASITSARMHTGDLDGDSLPDEWEIALLKRQNVNNPTVNDLNLTILPGGDPDSDGFTNLQEYKYGTDPLQGILKPLPIFWEDLRNTELDGSSGGLKKTTGTSAVFNADAFNRTPLPSDVQCHFSTAAPLGSIAFGFTYHNGLPSELDLEYAFVLSSTSANIRRPESTTNLSTGSYQANTIFGIKKTGSLIEFLRDGLVIYSSTTPVTGTLSADCSISTLNHKFTSVYQSRPDLDNDGLPDEWELRYLSLYATWQQLLDSNPTQDGPDNDGVNLLSEYLNGTSPTLSDTDTDGMPDLWEIQHGLAANNGADKTTDRDGDGLNNFDEFIYLTDVNLPDSDDDGIWDGYEVKHSLKPLDSSDALLDKDSDRIPNLWEFSRSTSSSDATNLPTWDATVDASLPNDLPLEKRFRSLSQAVDSLPSDLAYRSIIRILSTAPTSGSNLISPRSKLAIIGDSPSNSPPAQLDTYLLANADLYLDGIVLTRSPTSTNITPAIQVDRAFYQLPDDGNPPADPNYFASNGSFYYYYYPDPIPRVRIVNCLFRNLNTITNAFSPLPGALQNTAGTVSIEHCTFLNCGLRSSSSQTTSPSIRSTAPLTLKNSIVWDTGNGTILTNPNPVNLGPNPQSYTITSCLIQGGAYNSITTNPNLSPDGWLTNNSDPCLTSASPTNVKIDITHQPRPQTHADLGHSQWLTPTQDTDQDGIPDSYEITHTMNRRDSSDAEQDPDGDGIPNAQEFAEGTDPYTSELDPTALPGPVFYTRTKGAAFDWLTFYGEDGGEFEKRLASYTIYNHKGTTHWLTEAISYFEDDYPLDMLADAMIFGVSTTHSLNPYPSFNVPVSFSSYNYDSPPKYTIFPTPADINGWKRHYSSELDNVVSFHDEVDVGKDRNDNFQILPLFAWGQIRVESPALMPENWQSTYVILKSLLHTAEPIPTTTLTEATIPLGTVHFSIPKGRRQGKVDVTLNSPPLAVPPNPTSTYDHARYELVTPGNYPSLTIEPITNYANPEFANKEAQRAISISLRRTEITSDRATVAPKYHGTPTVPFHSNNPNHVAAGEKIKGALTIYHSAVRDGVGNTIDFDVVLQVDHPGDVSWTQTSGPITGQLLNSNSPTAIFRNPKKGGLYEFELSIEGKPLAQKLQLWLPVAGPDISFYWENEIADIRSNWGPSFRQRLDTLTMPLLLNPYLRWRAQQDLALAAMTYVGYHLDWIGVILGQETPSGSPFHSFRQGNRLTLHRYVISWSKRNNMMYALVGREMGIPEYLLYAGGHALNLWDSGTLDSPETREAYRAGFDLFNGVSLENVMRARGLNMQAPAPDWDQLEWPSHETSQDSLVRKAAQRMQDVIQ